MTTQRGNTAIEQNGREWELLTWLPGSADFREHRTRNRLQAAMEAVAHLHVIWQPLGGPHYTSHAIHRRLDRLTLWSEETHQQVNEAIGRRTEAQLTQWTTRALEQVSRWQQPAVQALRPRPSGAVPMQYCVCDVWHDHVLFEGHRVTGIVDYGSVRRDTVATDLARLLGSFLGDDKEQREYALDVYSRIRPLSKRERELVVLLDWTGVVVGAGNWLRWLYLENRVFENTEGVIQRLGELVTRMEGWQRPGIVT
jgi:Ser/Thr protein kinase RdoA (MazF antagonist)